MLWVATSNGLLAFSEKFERPDTIDFHLFVCMPNKREVLSCNDIYDILLTHDGRLFFATFGGGLNELKSLDKKVTPCLLRIRQKTDFLPTYFLHLPKIRKEIYGLVRKVV